MSGQHIRDAWHSRSPRERALIAAGLAVVVAAIAWGFVVEPLQRDLQERKVALREAQADLARARAQVDDLARLAGGPSGGSDAHVAAQTVIARRGLRPALTASQSRDGRVELTFEAVDFAALTALIDALGREARLFPVDALLAARTAPGSVRAEIILARPGP